jgi:hypothetical protein
MEDGAEGPEIEALPGDGGVGSLDEDDGWWKDES